MFGKVLRFCVVGGSGVVIDFGLTYLLKEKLRLHKYLSNALAFSVAASSNYFLNRIWTFESHNPEIFKEYSHFILIALIGLLINTGILYLLHTGKGKNFYVAKAFAMGVVMIWNFCANNWFTFKN